MMLRIARQRVARCNAAPMPDNLYLKAPAKVRQTTHVAVVFFSQ